MSASVWRWIASSEIDPCAKDAIVACSSGGSSTTIAGGRGCSEAGRGSLLKASAM